MRYDNSGHCDLARIHHFVPLVDDGGKVGILCTYCDYVLFEHVSSVYLTPHGDLIEIHEKPTSTMRRTLKIR